MRRLCPYVVGSDFATGLAALCAPDAPQIVVLSPDADTPLTTLDTGAIYIFPCLRADLITPRRAPRDAVSSVPIVVNFSPFKKRDTRIRASVEILTVDQVVRVHRRRSKPARSFDDRSLTPPHAVLRRRRVRRAARRPGAHGRGRARVRFPRTRSRPGPRLFVAADTVARANSFGVSGPGISVACVAAAACCAAAMCAEGSKLACAFGGVAPLFWLFVVRSSAVAPPW